jgi:hypothetical protein
LRRGSIGLPAIFWLVCSCTEPKSHETYDFVATLTEFSFETSAPSLPDCPYQGYCTHHRPFAGATLSGTLRFRDGMLKDEAAGEFGGLFRDAWQLDLGCTHVSELQPTSYFIVENDSRISADTIALFINAHIGDV